MLAAAVAVGSRADVPTQQRTARVVSAATTELIGDRGLLTVGRGNGPLDPLARANVVDVYRPYVESFGENVARPGAGSTPGTSGLFPAERPDGTATGRRAPGVDIPWATAQPGLDMFALRDVITSTSSTTADADRWLHLLDRYVADTAEVATTSGLDREDRQAVITNALDDVTFVAGAIQSPVISTAEAVEARYGGVASTAALGLSVASAPTGTPLSLAATAVGSLLPGLVPEGVPEARDAVLRSEPLLRERFAEPLYQAVIDQDVAGGMTPQEAKDENTALHPRSAEMSQRFGTGYALGSDLARTLGETT
jgi:hypothetical protein